MRNENSLSWFLSSNLFTPVEEGIRYLDFDTKNGGQPYIYIDPSEVVEISGLEVSAAEEQSSDGMYYLILILATIFTAILTVVAAKLWKLNNKKDQKHTERPLLLEKGDSVELIFNQSTI